MSLPMNSSASVPVFLRGGRICFVDQHSIGELSADDLLGPLCSYQDEGFSIPYNFTSAHAAMALEIIQLRKRVAALEGGHLVSRGEAAILKIEALLAKQNATLSDILKEDISDIIRGGD